MLQRLALENIDLNLNKGQRVNSDDFDDNKDDK